jgi:hypothetical protein
MTMGIPLYVPPGVSGGGGALAGDVVGPAGANALAQIAALAGVGGQLVGVDNAGNIVGVLNSVPYVVYHVPNAPNDGISHVIGSIDVSAARSFLIVQSFVVRNNVAQIQTSLRRVTVKGGPAPFLQADVASNNVSDLALPVVTQAIVGTNLTLSMAVPALAVSAYDITVYNEIFQGLGSPP